jgi:hypothetical protein
MAINANVDVPGLRVRFMFPLPAGQQAYDSFVPQTVGSHAPVTYEQFLS